MQKNFQRKDAKPQSREGIRRETIFAPNNRKVIDDFHLKSHKCLCVTASLRLCVEFELNDLSRNDVEEFSTQSRKAAKTRGNPARNHFAPNNRKAIDDFYLKSHKCLCVTASLRLCVEFELNDLSRNDVEEFSTQSRKAAKTPGNPARNHFCSEQPKGD